MVALSITVSVAQTSQRVGSPIAIKWQNPSANGFAIPAFFIVAVPPEVRFAGSGFFALTGGAKAPGAIAFAASDARALVPIHRRITSAKGGDISIIPYRRGQQAVRSAVVTTGECGEHVFGADQKMTLKCMRATPNW